MNIYPFCPLHQIAAFHLLISQATPFTDENCETNHPLGRTESCWKTRKRFFCTVRSHLVSCFNMLLRCVHSIGVRRALALFGDAKQAMGEGKSGPVKTGLTGPVAIQPCAWSNISIEIHKAYISYVNTVAKAYLFTVFSLLIVYVILSRWQV